MVDRSIFTIHFKNKPDFVYTNVVNFRIMAEGFLYLELDGSLDKQEAYLTPGVWIPTKDLLGFERTLKQKFETKKEFVEFFKKYKETH